MLKLRKKSNKYTNNISLEIKDEIINTKELYLIQSFIKSQSFTDFVSYFFFFTFNFQDNERAKTKICAKMTCAQTDRHNKCKHSAFCVLLRCLRQASLGSSNGQVSTK